MCFPGAAGRGAIADVGLFLNPFYGGAHGQLQAEVMLYLEVKSQDRYAHKDSQLKAHLAALEQETPNGVGFLAAIGGKPVQIEHPRWLGHTTLRRFLTTAEQVASAELGHASLAEEIRALLCSVEERAGQKGAASGSAYLKHV